MDKRILTLFGAEVALAFLAGRHSAPERIKIETKTEIKEVRVMDESRKLETTQRIIEVTAKDGSKRKETLTQTKRESEKETHQASASTVDQVKTVESKAGVNVQALFTLKDFKPVYGAAFSKKVIGPIHLGAFMFTDLRVGVSLGLEF